MNVWLRVTMLVCVMGAWGGDALMGQTPGRMAQYESRVYRLFTDLPKEQAKEAILRMTRMAEEYHRRTRDFSGEVRTRMPFYLYGRMEDYLAAGGAEGSAGFFDGQQLMAVAEEGEVSAQTWHTVQHEGFHQFAEAVMAGRRPIWLDEGLAEYFGEAAFTGDGFQSGLAPAWRVKRIKATLAAGKFMSVPEFLKMSHREWNARITVVDYDQAWSMTQFLAHGDDGKYQKAFMQYLLAISKGMDADRAWKDLLGEPADFGQAWARYWREVPEAATGDVYAQAAAATYASLLGRAVSQGQRFEDWEAFVEGVEGKTLKAHPEDWLPASLGDFAKSAGKLASWSLEGDPQSPRVVGVLADGTQVMGSITVRGGRVREVESLLDALPRIIGEAKALIAKSEKNEAKKILQRGIREYPKSSFLGEAKTLLAGLR